MHRGMGVPAGYTYDDAAGKYYNHVLLPRRESSRFSLLKVYRSIEAPRTTLGRKNMLFHLSFG